MISCGRKAGCLLQVSDEASDDPIALKDVQIPVDMLACLEACWAASGPGGAIRHALYKHPKDWVDLVRQVLRLDIRSLHQRTSMQGKEEGTRSSAVTETCVAQKEKTEHEQTSESAEGISEGGQSQTPKQVGAQEHANSQKQSPAPAAKVHEAHMCDSSTGKYSVTLHGVTISYDILPESIVLIRGASVG